MNRFESEKVKNGRSRYGSAVLNFDESKVERDEGGKFSIGSTKSGKPVYSKFEEPEHADFDKADHDDAADLHRAERDKHDDAAIDHFEKPEAEGFQKKSGYHSGEAQKHTRASLYGKKGPPKPREEKGAKTPGPKKGLGKDMTHEEIRAGEDARKDKEREKSFKSFGIK